MTNETMAAKAGLTASQQGLLLALACYTLWVAGDAALKTIALENLKPFEIAAVYSWIAAALLGGMAAARGNLAALKPVNTGALLARGLLLAGIAVFNFIAFARLSLPVFYTIIFLSPFFVALGARLFLGEAFSWGAGLTILAGFIGVVIAVNPASLLQGHTEWLGIAGALGAVLCFSATQLILRHVSHRETPESVVFSGQLISALATTIPALFTFTGITWRAILLMVLAAVINIAANFAMVIAMRKTAAANIAGLHYSQIIPGAIFGYLLWSDVPAWHVWVGSAVIMAAGLAMARLVNGKAA